MDIKSILYTLLLIYSFHDLADSAKCGNGPLALKCADNAQCVPSAIAPDNPLVPDSCECNDGFVGDANEGGSCVDAVQCAIDINCGPNTVCGTEQATCLCDANSVADATSDCINAAQCAIDQGCVPNTVCTPYDFETGKFSCECASDYYGNPNDQCLDEEGCIAAAGGCGDGAICRYYDVIGRDFYDCYCDTGLVGDAKVECITTDQCKQKAQCGAQNTVCTYYKGAYTCDCAKDFVGDPLSAEGCYDQPECSALTGCGENTVCAYDEIKDFFCSCANGFIGDPYQGCIDQTSCVTSGICGPNAYCNYNEDDANSNNGYVCYCFGGYEGDAYGSEGCLEINECELDENLCGSNAVCQNTPGVYECNCIAGYQGGAYAKDLGCFDCANDNWFCGANGQCRVNQQTQAYSCECKNGFSGTYCDRGELVISGVSSASLSSANYPGKYQYNANLLWTITADAGYGINLVFNDFRTEAGFDLLQLSDSSSAIGKPYSGDVLPAPVLSTDNVMKIAFISDDGDSRGGWKFEFKTSQEPACVTDNWMCQQGGLCKVTSNKAGYQCDCSATNGFSGKYCDTGDVNVVGETSGLITSINYPYSYPDNINSNWNIIAPRGYGIRIDVLDFNTEGFGHDVMILSDSSTVLWEYSGVVNGPAFVSTEDNVVNVQFTSDQDTTGLGWQIQWSTFAVSVSCEALTPPEDGYIVCASQAEYLAAGTSCVYQCAEGFGLVGYPVSVCNSDGSWDNEAPSCYAVKEPGLSSTSTPAQSVALTFIITTAVLLVIIIAGSCYILRDTDDEKDKESSLEKGKSKGSKNDAYSEAQETSTSKNTATSPL